MFASPNSVPLYVPPGLTVRAVGPGRNDWAVFARWLGDERKVCGPTSLWEATRWANSQA